MQFVHPEQVLRHVIKGEDRGGGGKKKTPGENAEGC